MTSIGSSKMEEGSWDWAIERVKCLERARIGQKGKEMTWLGKRGQQAFVASGMKEDTVYGVSWWEDLPISLSHDRHRDDDDDEYL
jgi:hypothetical protein